MWLASPLCPSAVFLPEGLEAAIETAGIATEPALAQWLLDQLHLTQSRSDLPLLAPGAGRPAQRRPGRGAAAERLGTANPRIGRTAIADGPDGPIAGRKWLRNQHAEDETALVRVRYLTGLPPTYPVALHFAAAHCGASTQQVLLAFGSAGQKTWCRRRSNPCRWPERRPARAGPARPGPARRR